MLDIASKITNEYLTIFIVLFSIYLFRNGRYNLASFISGLCMWIRPVGVLLFPSLLISLFIYRKDKITPKLFLSFLFPVLTLVFYNFYFFNNISPIYQLFVYKEVSPYGNSIGFVQVIADLIRSFKWGQFPIFFSGLFYFGLFIFAFIQTIKRRSAFNNEKDFFIILSGLLMILYIFSYSFTPFLENFARYLTPIIFMWWILFKKKIKIPRVAYFLILLSFIMAVK
jgi:hypothetical protein